MNDVYGRLQGLQNTEVLEYRILRQAKIRYQLSTAYFSSEDDTLIGDWPLATKLLQKAMRLMLKNPKFEFPERSNVYKVVNAAINALALELAGAKRSSMYPLVRSLIVHWFMSTIDRYSDQPRGASIKIEEYFQDLGTQHIIRMFDLDWDSAKMYHQFVDDVAVLNANFYRKYKSDIVLFLIPSYTDYLQYTNLCKQGWGEYLFEQLEKHAKKPTFFVNHSSLQAIFATCVEDSDREDK